MKDKWKLYLLLLLGVSNLSQSAITNIDNLENIQRAERAQRDLERTQRLLELRQKQEYINQQLMYAGKKINSEKDDALANIEDGKKYLFTDIRLEGSNSMKRETDKIIAKYINTEMNKQDMYELLTKLSNVFLAKGYSTTLVTIKSGNVNIGELVYEVKEGKVRDVKFLEKENGFRDKVRIGLAFPIGKDDLLNTRDMDQGIENMNIGGTNNIAEITPTEQYGYSDIFIEENYTTTGFTMGMDNSGYKDKGRDKVNFNFSQDNLLGINDMLTFNYIERLTKKRDFDKESNYDIGYSVPIGYWKIAYNYNLGDNYNSYYGQDGTRYVTESKSEKHKIKVSRVLSRGQYSKTAAHGGLVIRDNENTVAGTLVEVSSKKYANTTLAIDHTNKLFGGTFFGMIEYERGVPWFGAEGDPSPLTSGAFKIEYDKVNMNIDWMKYFNVKDHGFQYRMGIGASYSDDRLLAANQFTMGDEYTVRGFKESSVAGNKGIYINNTITYLGAKDMNRFLSMFKPFIGLDGGVSRDRDLPTSDKIMGMALGVKFNAGHLNASFTYGIPLMWAKDMPHEKNPIYFNVSYSF